MQTFEALIKGFFSGDQRALARVISLIENRDHSVRRLIAELFPKSGNAFIVGITGPPGAGKSTVTDCLISKIRAAGQSVAVIAVDPSSPFSGGAILGDRIRMQSHLGDNKVFIRSLGTRGTHGGLSGSTREVVLACDAAGFDWILVETAGVGQTELDIMQVAHMVCVVLVPESGDGIQVMKAGLMEIADIFVVNKADRPEADKIVKELITMGELNDHSKRQIPVFKTEALHGKGIAEFYDGIQACRKDLEGSEEIKTRRARFLQQEVEEILHRKMTANLAKAWDTAQGKALIAKMQSRQINPYEAAEQIDEA